MQKILIVEDDRELNMALCYAIEKNKYTAVQASSVREAREIYRKEEVRLIILDINLPDGDGFGLPMGEGTEEYSCIIPDSTGYGGGRIGRI